MNRLHLLLAAGLVVLVGALATMTPPSSSPSPTSAAKLSPDAFVIRDVRLFDGERFHDRRSVLVRGGRIESVGVDLPVPPGFAVVDGAGRTLLPGLVDAHVHTWGAARRDALRFGVTTMLDMFSDPRQMAAARAERTSLAATDRADLWSAGLLATAAKGHGTQYGMAIPTLASPAEAEAWVQARQDEGSDYIKIVREDLHVYREGEALPTLDAATAAAVIGAARQRGLQAVVHASAQEAARESLRDGAQGLVHVFQDAVADDGFIALARERGAFVVPTLTVVAGFAGEHSVLADDSRVAPWLSSDQRQTLTAQMMSGAANPTLLATARESVRRLHAAGVPVLAGTDAPNPNTAHGVSMHEEIVWLARSGLSPAQALAAATSVPADAFGLSDRGRIAPGLRADLLLVEGDPSQDLGDTLSIVTIWKNGREVDRRIANESLAALPAGLVSDFESEAIESRYGSGWVATSDRMAGGQSQAALERIAGGAGGSAGALRVSGRVHKSGSAVWAGAFFNPGGAMMQAMDAKARTELVLQLRGDGRPLAVMLFSGAQGSAPAIITVTPGVQWGEVRLRLADFPGADLGRLRAFAITARSPEGDFRFDLDQVEIR